MFCARNLNVTLTNKLHVCVYEATLVWTVKSTDGGAQICLINQTTVNSLDTAEGKVFLNLQELCCPQFLRPLRFARSMSSKHIGHTSGAPQIKGFDISLDISSCSQPSCEMALGPHGCAVDHKCCRHEQCPLQCCERGLLHKTHTSKMLALA